MNLKRTYPGKGHYVATQHGWEPVNDVVEGRPSSVQFYAVVLTIAIVFVAMVWLLW